MTDGIKELEEQGVRASEITRGAEARVVADRMAKLSDIVAAAGVTDVAEGLALLDESEDVDLMSALVGLMSAADLERGLKIARIAGELRAVSDVIDLLKLPVMSAFLQSRGEEAAEGFARMAMSAGLAAGSEELADVAEGTT